MVPESPLKVPHRLSLHDRFLPRLCKIFLGILSTERVWDDHWNRIKKEDRHKVFRINLALDEEPVLDDVDKISKIEQRSQDFLETYNFGGVIRALLASNFYFELEKPPRDRKHAFVCTGSIRCRSPDTRALVQRVLEEYPMASIIMEDKDNFGRITFEQVCDRCSRFHKDISFHVRHLSEVTAICIKFNSTETYRISGFPQSMEDVVQKQMLYACFGTSDHRELDCSPTHQCKGLVRKKRTRTSDRQFSQQKRRMLCKDGF